ncbi:MAG: cyclopropane fatty acyl phospholipid synthase [archaeon]
MTREETAKKLLATADIRINGNRPWDMRINNPKTYQRVLAEGSIGLGESYMDGWWDCDRLDIFFEKLISVDLERVVRGNWIYLRDAALAKVINLQSPKRAFEVGEKHYDNGNDLYALMLDPRMVYTCAYWEGLKEVPQNLAKAQEQKLDLVCKKLGLKKGMKVLEIGCGWGSFMKFAAEKYGVSVVGYTISKEQVELGKKMCKGLPVEFKLEDYRNAKKSGEQFDRIVSLGMFEHVGYKNYREYMEVAHTCLKSGGLFLLHTIGNKVSQKIVDPWTNKYIFPNGHLPSVSQITFAAEGLFDLEDFHSFGRDYAPTCMAWNYNFIKNWDKIKKIAKENGEPRYNDRFFRMWTYWLQMSAGSFTSKFNKLWQVVFSKDRKEDYVGVR